MNFKKLAVLIIIPLMILSFYGCSNTKNASGSSKAASSKKTASSSSSDLTYLGFSLPYTNVTSLNPLLPASAVNEEFSPLVYDCISEPDSSYNPVMRLASAVTSSGTTVKITLRDGVSFSDGSALTGSDVAYSLNFVKNNQSSPYNANLSNVNSITSDGSTVTLTLGSPDPLIANLLDIPIIKKGSDAAGDAIGSGMYTFSKNGVNAVLNQNPKWYGGNSAAFKSIPLVNIPDQSTINSCLEIDQINYVYSDNGSGSTPSFVNTKTAQVNLNRLVYVGINTSKPRLNNNHFRRALSLSIDRKMLSSQTYSNRAVPSALPFNPAFKLLGNQSGKDITADYNAVSSEMTQAGGTGGTNAAALTVLVNQENSVRVAVAKYIVSCFSKAGVNVSLKEVPFTEYQQLISGGDFDMYVGEVELADNMDISPLLASGGSAAFGAPQNSSTLAAFKAWQSGSGNFDGVTNDFSNEMPFLPLCYRIGSTSYTNGINNVTATNADIFYDFEKWTHN